MLVALAARVPFSSDILRSRIVETLSERLEAKVELGDVWLRALPRLHAQASDLRLHHQGREDVPPLIAVRDVIVDADLLGLWRKHVAHVDLVGLSITIPPGGIDSRPSPEPEIPPAVNGTPAGGASTATAAAAEQGAGQDVDPTSPGKLEREVVIDELIADDATLTILRSQPQKRPRVWQMHELHVRQVGAQTQMPFKTHLTNAVPPGQIDTSGAFGPWQRDDPGKTPVEGLFTFRNADLSVFKGISGILAAEGSYRGSLKRIAIEGQTDTPEFVVNVAGHKVPLKASYRATVDATNGNTILETINARFFNTSLLAKGGVYEIEGVKGRIVTLDVEIADGRLEDVMPLAVKTPTSPMTGALMLNTKFKLPPGDQDVVEKLELDGVFSITDGRFTNQGVQQRINELSHRARGRKQAQPKARVGSDFSGRFQLGNGRLRLSKLTFDIPGAIVELTGEYGIKSERLTFAGSLYMDAKVSQTVTGWKSLLLKVVDPLFRKNGQTVIPIKISGTRDKPQFGLDTKRIF